MDGEQLNCINSGPDDEPCWGPVEYRTSLTPTGNSYVRCDRHWNERLAFEEAHRLNYPDSSIAPEWFDPADAGECWDDDY